MLFADYTGFAGFSPFRNEIAVVRFAGISRETPVDFDAVA
jgi:hypothetical protein